MADEVLPATGAVSAGVAVPPEALWPFVSDPSMPARFSSELVEAAFVDGGTARVGAEIEGRNESGTFSWTTRSTVVDCVEPSLFRWATGGADEPGATWSLEVAPASGGSTLTHRVVLHEGRAPLGPAIAAEPERAREIVDGRMAIVLENMRRVVEGISALAEGTAAQR